MIQKTGFCRCVIHLLLYILFRCLHINQLCADCIHMYRTLYQMINTGSQVGTSAYLGVNGR